MLPNRQDSTTLLQWNCRGIKDKSAALQQYLGTLSPPPDIIAVQETNGPTKLPGYVTYTDPSGRSTATLIKSNIAALQHLTPQRECEHTLVELIPRTAKCKESIFILNVYCRPSKKRPGIKDTVCEALQLAGSSPLLILGDLNAAHKLWGYTYNSKRGKDLLSVIESHNLTLLNDPHTPTRTGNSVSRDTSPDLSLLRGSLDITWTNTMENLGSDHDIIRVLIKGLSYRSYIGTAKLTDWDKFRKERKDRDHSKGQSYDQWAESVVRDVKANTKTIATTYQTPHVDSKLLHIWKARHSLTRRWKKQRHNRRLKKRIAQLSKQAAEYAAHLCKENWLTLCDSLQGTLSTRKTWHLLRHLIDPLKNKGETSRSLARTMHLYQGTTDDLIQDLKNKYLRPGKGGAPPLMKVHPISC